TSYPFSMHSILSLPWDYSTSCKGFFLMSHSCTSRIEINRQCKACDVLGKNGYLEKIIARYNYGVHENAPLVFHGIGGLIDIIHRKRSANSHLRLHLLNNIKKLVGKEGILNDHKQMMVTISL
ncbi:hypothetical protein BC826DRAFT_920293, partial [Russula brevipes]